MGNLFGAWLRGTRIQQTQYHFNGRSVALDYALPGGAGPFPAVLLLHGSNGAASSAPTMRLVMQALAGMGYAGFFPHYFDSTGHDDLGSGPGRDAAIDQSFVRWQETIAAAIETVSVQPVVDPERVGLVGFSLGSFLALAVAEGRDSVRCVIEFCGGLPENLRGRSLTLPPVLILHGEEDTVVPVARAAELQQALEAGQIQYEIRRYPGQGHVFSGMAEADALQRCRAFLQKHLSILPTFE